MEPISREPLRSTVRRVLLDRVLAGDLPPDRPLVESEVASALGVSRTPLREALIGLEAEGIIESRPGRGFSVVPLSESEGRDLYALVGLLEGAALRQAELPDEATLAALEALDRSRLRVRDDPAERIELDTSWHEELLASCPNRKLLWILSILRGQLYRYEYAFQKERPRVEAAIGEHREIIAMLRAGDRDGAADLLETHLRSGVDAISQCFGAS